MKSTHTLLLVALMALAATRAGADEHGPVTRHDLQTLDGPVIAERVLDGIVEPVAIEFLPDGTALVLERKAGQVVIADFRTGGKTPVTGLPPVHVKDSAGVHDVQLHPDSRS